MEPTGMPSREKNISSGSRSRFFYGYIIVGLGFLSMMVGAGLWDSFGVFLKPLINDFGWSRAVTSSAYSLSFLIYGLAGVIAGGLTDKFGPRVVLTACGLLLGLGYLLLSQIGSLWQLFLFEGVIIGVGMSGLYAPILAMVARWFVRRRGLMTGIVLAGLGIGQLAAPPVISRLISAYDWRLSYIILGITVLIAVVLSTQFLKRDPALIGQRPLGQDADVQSAAESSQTAYSLREAAGTAQLWIMLLIKLCYGYYMFLWVVHIVAHVSDLGYSPATAASILAASGGGVVLGNFVLGRAVDRTGPRKIFIGCFLAAAAIMIWLMQAEELWMLYTIAILLGLANGGNMTCDSPMLVRLFGLKSLGSLVGASSGSFAIGAAVGPVVTGYIFDITGSYYLAFPIGAAFALAGLVLVLIIRPTRRLKTGI